MLGPKPRKNSGSHIDASHSRQPLVKGERLVRNEVNAVMSLDWSSIDSRCLYKYLGYFSWSVQFKNAGAWPAGRLSQVACMFCVAGASRVVLYQCEHCVETSRTVHRFPKREITNKVSCKLYGCWGEGGVVVGTAGIQYGVWTSFHDHYHDYNSPRPLTRPLPRLQVF